MESEGTERIANRQRQRVAAYALIHEAGNILLCRISRQLPRWAGYWTLPGGGLEFGESPEDAVIREVREETGLLVKPRSVAKIDSLFLPEEKVEYHGLRIIYHVEIVGGELQHEQSGTTDVCAWHRLHPTLEIPLVDLAELGVRLAQETWPAP